MAPPVNPLDQQPGESEAEWAARLKRTAADTQAKLLNAEGNLTVAQRERDTALVDVTAAKKSAKKWPWITGVLAILSIIFMFLWLNAPDQDDVKAGIEAGLADAQKKWEKDILAPVVVERDGLKTERDKLAGDKTRLEGERDTALSRVSQLEADNKSLDQQLRDCQNPKRVGSGGGRRGSAGGNVGGQQAGGAVGEPRHHVCRVVIDGAVMADFGSRDANYLKEYVKPNGEGPKCAALRRKFFADHPQYTFAREVKD